MLLRFSNSCFFIVEALYRTSKVDFLTVISVLRYYLFFVSKIYFYFFQDKLISVVILDDL